MCLGDPLHSDWLRRIPEIPFSVNCRPAVEQRIALGSLRPQILKSYVPPASINSKKQIWRGRKSLCASYRLVAESIAIRNNGGKKKLIRRFSLRRTFRRSATSGDARDHVPACAVRNQSLQLFR